MTDTASTTGTQQGQGDNTESPLDNATYNLVSALHTKLEGIEVMNRYAQDDDSGIFQRIASDDRRHAEELLQQLRQRLGGSGSGGG